MIHLWRNNRSTLDVLKVTKEHMSKPKHRSLLERIATVLSAAYKIIRVGFDLYILVRGH
jgi:hypothetical protein